MMKISIITVCYNSVSTIGRTLRSVREQTYESIEHIVIDGGSTDGTLDILSHEGLHLAAIISDKDDGIYDAMNKGLSLATGDIIAFLNADDLYKDKYVISNVLSIMNSEKLDALYGDVEFFKEGAEERVVRRYDSSRFTPDRLGWGFMPAHPALFIRRVLFDELGKFRTDFQIAGDFEFIVRLFTRDDLIFKYYPYCLVRMQLGGVSTSGIRATLKLNSEIIRGCRANGITTNWLKLLARYPLKLLEFLVLR